MKALKPGLMLLCMLMLGGCSWKRQPELASPVLPPQALMQQGPALHIPASGTNGDMLETILSLIADKGEAEKAKERLRQWRKEHE